MRWGVLVAQPESKIIHSRVLMGNLKDRENWEGLGLDGMMILNFSLLKLDARTWIDFGNYLDQVADCWKTLIVMVL
jgi:hypothetical protein